MRDAAFAVCSFVVLAVAIGHGSLPSAQSITIAMPAEWVPFSADVRHSYDATVTTGTFHRRRDGSTAMILDTPGGVAITIHNLQTRLTYVKLGDRAWATRVLAERALDPYVLRTDSQAWSMDSTTPSRKVREFGAAGRSVVAALASC